MLTGILLFKYALVYTQIFSSSFYNGTILLAIRLATAVLHPFTSYTFRIQTTADNHEAAQALRDMIKTDGAGSWPPKASHRVDLSAVESILLAVEKGTDRSLLSESACNGLFACIGHLRHGFRYVPFYIYHA